MGQSAGKPMLNCRYCKKDYYQYPSKMSSSKYCCKKCKDADSIGRKRVISNKQCTICSEMFYAKPSHLLKRFTCSRVCQGKYRTQKSLRRDHKPAQYRKTHSYWQWMLAVKNRDKWSCVNCGDKTKVIAHHIFRFWSFPEFRYSVDNGMTLCKSCHTTVSKYDRQWELQRL